MTVQEAIEQAKTSIRDGDLNRAGRILAPYSNHEAAQTAVRFLSRLQADLESARAALEAHNIAAAETALTQLTSKKYEKLPWMKQNAAQFKAQLDRLRTVPDKKPIAPPPSLPLMPLPPSPPSIPLPPPPKPLDSRVWKTGSQTGGTIATSPPRSSAFDCFPVVVKQGQLTAAQSYHAFAFSTSKDSERLVSGYRVSAPGMVLPRLRPLHLVIAFTAILVVLLGIMILTMLGSTQFRTEQENTARTTMGELIDSFYPNSGLTIERVEVVGLYGSQQVGTCIVLSERVSFNFFDAPSRHFFLPQRTNSPIPIHEPNDWTQLGCGFGNELDGWR